MKNHIYLSAGIVTLLLGTLLFAGCAATARKSGFELAEKTTATMNDVNSDMKQASMQIDATNVALTDLMRTGRSASAQPADVKKAFDTYEDNVAKMDDIGNRLNDNIDKMNARGSAYFQEWAKEGATYTDPDIQKLSQERRVRLQGSFTDIASASAGMRGSLNAYLSELKQIQIYLSNDLTPEGISAIASTAMAAQRDGNNLKSSFTPVQTAIAKARNDMMPGGAAAGGTMQQSDQFNPIETQ